MIKAEKKNPRVLSRYSYFVLLLDSWRARYKKPREIYWLKTDLAGGIIMRARVGNEVRIEKLPDACRSKLSTLSSISYLLISRGRMEINDKSMLRAASTFKLSQSRERGAFSCTTRFFTLAKSEKPASGKMLGAEIKNFAWKRN